MNKTREHFANWRANPRRWEIAYVASRIKTLLQGRSAERSRKRAADAANQLLNPAIECEYVDLLFDPEFQRSVTQVKDYSCLDVVRLANLWTTARLTGPGIFVEVGTYKGGTALHICNAMGSRDSAFYCFDPFENGGFEKLTDCDAAFEPDDFRDTQYEAVVKLLSSKPNAKVIQGFFPAVAEGLCLQEIAFGHLDVDTYEATKDSLEYLAPRLAIRGLLVLDDLGHRETPGVKKALDEFVAKHPSFVAIPMFPCQAVLLPKSFREANA